MMFVPVVLSAVLSFLYFSEGIMVQFRGALGISPCAMGAALVRMSPCGCVICENAATACKIRGQSTNPSAMSGALKDHLKCIKCGKETRGFALLHLDTWEHLDISRRCERLGRRCDHRRHRVAEEHGWVVWICRARKFRAFGTAPRFRAFATKTEISRLC